MGTINLDGYRFVENRALDPRRRVLVVEDEKECEILIERAIRAVDQNAKLQWVRSAEDAEDILKTKSNFDLIVADHFLKGDETGLALWKTCQKKYSQIPFILTSAMSSDLFQLMVKAERRPPYFLHKPFQVSDCKKTVEWFWDEPASPNTKIFTQYKILATVLLVLLLSHTPRNTHISKSSSVQSTHVVFEAPLRLVIPRMSHSHQKTIHGKDNLLSRRVKEEIIRIQLRADDIIESFSSGSEAFMPLTPKIGPKLKTYESNDKLEKYARLSRTA